MVSEALEEFYALRPEFVGREKEFEELKSYLDESMAGKGNVIFVRGEAGIGKTRLVEELKNYARAKNVQILTGRCLYQTGSNPYLPFVEALREYLTSVEENLRRKSLEEIRKSSPEFMRMLPRVLIPIAEDNESKDMSSFREGIDIQTEKTRMFETVFQLINNITNQKPILLFLDDLQWADNASLQLLHYIARNAKHLRLLICGAYRSEELVNIETVHPLRATLMRMSRDELYRIIELNCLSYPDTLKLVQSTLKKAIPENFATLIYKETEGNPFFIEETLKAMLELGLINLKDERWYTKLDTAKLGVPSTIRDVILARINRLDKDSVKILEFAAVIGEEFQSDIIQKCLELDDEKLLDCLDILIEMKLIYEMQSTEEELYKFNHAKTQEVIYNELSKPRQRITHEKIAHITEELYKNRLDTVTYTLARHYFLGKVADKAMWYLSRSGKKAISVYANDEAIEFYLKELEVLEELKADVLIEEKQRVHTSLGDIYFLIGKCTEALEHYQSVLNYVSSDAIATASLQHKIGTVYYRISEYDRALEHYNAGLKALEGKPVCKELSMLFGAIGFTYMKKSDYELANRNCKKELALAQELNNEKEIAQAYSNLGVLSMFVGETSKGYEYFEKCLEIREKLKDDRGVANICNNLGILFTHKGNYEKALEYFKRSTAIREKIGDLAGIAISYNALGGIYKARGDLDKGLNYYAKSLELCEKIGDNWGVAAAYGNIGNIYMVLGDFDKALEYHEKSLGMSLKTGDKRSLSISYHNLGELYFKKGDVEKAFAHYEKSMELARKLSAKLMEAYNCSNISELWLHAGNLEKAENYCTQAFSMSKKLEAKELPGTCLRLLGTIYKRKRKWSEAEAKFNSSLNILKEVGKEVEIARTLFEYGLMLKSRGNVNEGETKLKEALAIFKRLGIKFEVEKITKELEDINKSK